jgi:monoamine oxidase
VLVIGAGIAGLGASRMLHDSGYAVTVLEARDRIGGRIWTDRSWESIPIDLGASWIHGIDGNPIWDLVGQLGIDTAVTDYDQYWLYGPDGALYEDDAQNAITERFDDLLAALDELREAMRAAGELDISLAEGIARVLPGLDLTTDELRELNYAIDATVEHEYAADTSRLSLYYWDADSEVFDDDVIFPGGYDQIATSLADGLDIRTGAVVSRIQHGESGIRVTTGVGAFDADYAIVTTPLGVLRHGDVQFDPPLPPDKQGAIERLDMGLLSKVWLRFPQAFWDADAQFIGRVPAERGAWVEWLNLSAFTGVPVLAGFNAGEFAWRLEEQTDEEIIAGAMDALRSIYGDGIPEPDAWLMSRWGSDPLARGAYSFIPVGASPGDRLVLGQPVGFRLLFAGEATSPDNAGTVHGAYLSGVREAARLMGG